MVTKHSNMVTYLDGLLTKELFHTELGRVLTHRVELPPLDLDSHLPKKNYFICFNETFLTMMKNTFYFILKAISVLKIFKFLSRLLVM